MTKTIDGFVLDVPPVASQVIALAQYHHQQLDKAILHQDIHLGEYGLKQQFQLDTFVDELSDADREKFNKIYTEELYRLAEQDHQHAHHEAEKANLALIFVILAIIAVILYFTFAHRLMS
ncbi:MULTISPECIES: hypothetical protein [unclassified Acinetobacter]|uniref:hypothetical protein n=1 Tax=unclassified Acinetobacter TaxID=196816 RepID=UPI00293531CA|nr:MULTISPECIES: hypothetical protein [unclassified Acinetobacter]WOE31938.1 hypothetical protein QSG84_01555 [Acinetobacter sp. SAAs470]WOE37406.1 hypothetical protein QSG86_10600 [Acinetobacter sp. SAAs474]